tara:strand:- start:326 stop:544 length:219 start_codon:yes stop_codon:yes gene_type:complete
VEEENVENVAVAAVVAVEESGVADSVEGPLEEGLAEDRAEAVKRDVAVLPAEVEHLAAVEIRAVAAVSTQPT